MTTEYNMEKGEWSMDNSAHRYNTNDGILIGYEWKCRDYDGTLHQGIARKKEDAERNCKFLAGSKH